MSLWHQNYHFDLISFSVFPFILRVNYIFGSMLITTVLYYVFDLHTHAHTNARANIHTHPLCILALLVTLCRFRLALQGYSVASLSWALRSHFLVNLLPWPWASCFELIFWLGSIFLSLQLKLSSAILISLVLTNVTLSSATVLNISSRNLTKYNTQQHNRSCKHAKQITSHL